MMRKIISKPVAATGLAVIWLVMPETRRTENMPAAAS